MKRLRAGAYASGDYLIRYHAWLGEVWDGPRSTYKPWHIFRRASDIDRRILLDRTFTLQEAQAFIEMQQKDDIGKSYL